MDFAALPGDVRQGLASRAARSATDLYKSLWGRRGGVWGGEEGPFSRKAPPPLPNSFLQPLQTARQRFGLAGADAGDRGKLGGRGGNDGIKGLEMIPEQPGRGLAYAGDAEQFGGKRRARPRPAVPPDDEMVRRIADMLEKQ